MERTRTYWLWRKHSVSHPILTIILEENEHLKKSRELEVPQLVCLYCEQTSNLGQRDPKPSPLEPWTTPPIHRPTPGRASRVKRSRRATMCPAGSTGRMELIQRGPHSCSLLASSQALPPPPRGAPRPPRWLTHLRIAGSSVKLCSHRRWPHPSGSSGSRRSGLKLAARLLPTATELPKPLRRG